MSINNEVAPAQCGYRRDDGTHIEREVLLADVKLRPIALIRREQAAYDLLEAILEPLWTDINKR